ncbi:cell division protein ZapA [Suttonella sp. R2A3]|uniref:cell division protein ZapA n=1 Tax=Suttonella sp. R2A3 TaxID=2908648 RepID=UPI001F420718|nr:cell division protein ZapA [Suttonella sp. R2A3]UJF25199.1 cell division protein ZapA [Suttonella sp. R2A3]
MSKEKIKVSLSVLENPYQLMCEPHDRNLLIESAELLNTHLQDLRNANPKLSHERLLVMGALQMTFDLLQERQTLAHEVSSVNQLSARLISALDMANGELPLNK